MRHDHRTIAILLLASVLAASVGTTASYADDDDPVEALEGAAGIPNDDDDDEGVETEDLFGFTEGASTDEAGESEISMTTTVGVKRRGLEEDEGVEADDAAEGADGRPSPIDYTAVEAEIEAEHALTDRLKVEAGLAFVYYDTRFDDEFENNRFDFGGLSAGAKYALLKSTEAMPINLAVAVEGEWERSSEESGDEQNGYGVTVGFLGDIALIPDRLFAAANFALSTETSEPEESGDGWEKESSFDLSMAMSYRMLPNIFVGVEARVSEVFEGSFFDKHAGTAVFVGPTAYAALGERAYLKAAWSTQVTGHSNDDPDRDLDLLDFSQNTFLVGGGINF